MNQKMFQDEFDIPLNGPAPTQQSRRWPLSTLMAIRPSASKHNRSYAEDWNERYRDIPEVQVNAAAFPEVQPERSPEEIEESNQWLQDLGNGIMRPNPRFY